MRGEATYIKYIIEGLMVFENLGIIKHEKRKALLSRLNTILKEK